MCSRPKSCPFNSASGSANSVLATSTATARMNSHNMRPNGSRGRCAKELTAISAHNTLKTPVEESSMASIGRTLTTVARVATTPITIVKTIGIGHLARKGAINLQFPASHGARLNARATATIMRLYSRGCDKSKANWPTYAMRSSLCGSKYTALSMLKANGTVLCGATCMSERMRPITSRPPSRVTT